MPRALKTATRAAPWLAAAALLCATSVLPPNAARAQTAGNLNCNKCVNTRDVARRAITRSRLRNNAVTFRKVSPGVEGAIKQDRTFYVTLDSSGDEATLVRQGPLRIFARCFVNDAGFDRIEIIFTSTANGWFTIGDPTERSAGDEVIVGDFPSPISPVATGTTATGQLFLQPGAIAPDGSTIGVGTEYGAGLNVFGHACLVEGSATAFTGNP